MAGPPNPDIITWLFQMMFHPAAVASRLHASRLIDRARTWIDPNGYRLSDRIWRQRAEVRKAIEDRIRDAIADGDSAIRAAEDLEQFLHPAMQPTRTRAGRIVSTGRTPHPGPGVVSARRLMRTEVTRVAGQETLEIAEALDLDMEWRLSNRHPRYDICDEHAAGHSRGKPPGVYTRDELPTYPAHPQDLCLVTTYDDMSDDELLAHLRKKYNLPPPSQARLFQEDVA